MTTFPAPHSTMLAHSEKLTQLIRDEIKNQPNDAITFARFMDLALYAPGLGYYSAGMHKLGRQGDFVTAPEISPLFAQCVANQCKQIMSELNVDTILEFGAGSGIFAKELLLELERLGSLPSHYFILEISADLKARQQQLLAASCPHLSSTLVWLNELPSTPIDGIVLANEVIDAMPVHRFAFKNNSLSEQCVKIENEHFAWCDRAPSPELTLYLETLLEDCSLSADFCSEARPIQSAWLASVAHMLNKGLLLIFDYGYSRREYYRPERNDGTLMCFYQHHMHVDPLQLVGLQDITAHVDFTHLAESALDSGLCVYGFTNQAAFLLSCGILDRAQKESLNSDILKYKQNQSIKSLTLPSQMGEISKVIALGKECDITLIGFSLQDRRQDL